MDILILVFEKRRLEPRLLSLEGQNRCQFVPFATYISGATFQEQCLNISRDIHDSVFQRLFG